MQERAPAARFLQRNPYKFLRILLYAVGNNVKEDQSFDEQKYFRDPAPFKKF